MVVWNCHPSIVFPISLLIICLGVFIVCFIGPPAAERNYIDSFFSSDGTELQWQNVSSVSPFVKSAVLSASATVGQWTYYRIDYENQDTDHQHTWPGEYLSLSVESLTFANGDVITFDDFSNTKTGVQSIQNKIKANSRSSSASSSSSHSSQYNSQDDEQQQLSQNEKEESENENTDLNFFQRIKLVPMQKRSQPTDFPADTDDDDDDWFAESPAVNIMLNKYGEAYSNLTVPNHYNETDVGLYVCEYGSAIVGFYATVSPVTVRFLITTQQDPADSCFLAGQAGDYVYYFTSMFLWSVFACCLCLTIASAIFYLFIHYRERRGNYVSLM